MYTELIKGLAGFDRKLTEKYYDKQLSIQENCSCDSCKYFEEVFLKKELKLFSVLKEFGIDLRKDQEFDPAGITMVLDEEGEFVFCETVFVLAGDFSDFDDEDLEFEFNEESITISINVHLEDDHTILLFIDFENA